MAACEFILAVITFAGGRISFLKKSILVHDFFLATNGATTIFFCPKSEPHYIQILLRCNFLEETIWKIDRLSPHSISIDFIVHKNGVRFFQRIFNAMNSNLLSDYDLVNTQKKIMHTKNYKQLYTDLHIYYHFSDSSF